MAKAGPGNAVVRPRTVMPELAKTHPYCGQTECDTLGRDVTKSLTSLALESIRPAAWPAQTEKVLEDGPIKAVCSRQDHVSYAVMAVGFLRRDTPCYGLCSIVCRPLCWFSV